MFFVNLDMSEVEDLFGLKAEAETQLRKAANRLAVQTKAHILEQANQKLHTRRGMFIEGLTHFQLDESTWVIQLDASVRWIDEGMPEHDMLERLLESKKAKKSKKDGTSYVVVPFQLNQAKQQLTPAQQTLLATVKKELAKVGETPNRIETDARGKAKLGLVRSLDITQAPINKRTGPVGRGGFGDVAQGPTGIPLLSGVQVYQREFKDKSGANKVGRFLMTFRVASSKHKDQMPGNSSQSWKNAHPDKPTQQARWHHPGVEATNLMQEGLEWAEREWARKVGPDLLAALAASIS